MVLPVKLEKPFRIFFVALVFRPPFQHGSSTMRDPSSLPPPVRLQWSLYEVWMSSSGISDAFASAAADAGGDEAPSSPQLQAQEVLCQMLNLPPPSEPLTAVDEILAGQDQDDKANAAPAKGKKGKPAGDEADEEDAARDELFGAVNGVLLTSAVHLGSMEHAGWSTAHCRHQQAAPPATHTSVCGCSRCRTARDDTDDRSLKTGPPTRNHPARPFTSKGRHITTHAKHSAR